MSDKDTIEQAYSEILKKLFSNLFEAYVIAKNQADKDLAAKRFTTGLSIARDARTKALTLV